MGLSKKMPNIAICQISIVQNINFNKIKDFKDIKICQN